MQRFGQEVAETQVTAVVVKKEKGVGLRDVWREDGRAWFWMGAGEEADDGEGCEAASPASGLSAWRDGAAICRGGKHGEKTGFCGEIVSFMSLVSGMLSLKAL